MTHQTAASSYTLRNLVADIQDRDAALLLNQIVYYSFNYPNHEERNGWFWHTLEQWHREWCYTKRTLQSSVSKLEEKGYVCKKTLPTPIGKVTFYRPTKKAVETFWAHVYEYVWSDSAEPRYKMFLCQGTKCTDSKEQNVPVNINKEIHNEEEVNTAEAVEKTFDPEECKKPFEGREIKILEFKRKECSVMRPGRRLDPHRNKYTGPIKDMPEKTKEPGKPRYELDDHEVPGCKAFYDLIRNHKYSEGLAIPIPPTYNNDSKCKLHVCIYAIYNVYPKDPRKSYDFLSWLLRNWDSVDSEALTTFNEMGKGSSQPSLTYIAKFKDNFRELYDRYLEGPVEVDEGMSTYEKAKSAGLI